MPVLVDLLIWSLGLAALAVPAATILAFWIRRRARRAGKSAGLRMMAAATLPFAMIGVAAVWYVGYSVSCLAFRGVDPGIGDEWNVPIGHGYEFYMIDDVDAGTIGRNAEEGEAIVADIRQAAYAGDRVVGVTADGRAFTLDLPSGTLTRMSSREELLASTSPRPDLAPTFNFYRNLRITWVDDAEGLILVGAELAPAWVWLRRLRATTATRSATNPPIKI